MVKGGGLFQMRSLFCVFCFLILSVPPTFAKTLTGSIRGISSDGKIKRAMVVPVYLLPYNESEERLKVVEPYKKHLGPNELKQIADRRTLQLLDWAKAIQRFYFTRTDVKGDFTIKGIKEGTYYLLTVWEEGERIWWWNHKLLIEQENTPILLNQTNPADTYSEMGNPTADMERFRLFMLKYPEYVHP